MGLDSIGREREASSTSSKLEELLSHNMPKALIKTLKKSKSWQDHVKVHAQADIVDVDLSVRAQPQPGISPASTPEEKSSSDEESGSPVHTRLHEELSLQKDVGGEYLTGKPVPVTCNCGAQIDVKVSELGRSREDSAAASPTYNLHGGEARPSKTRSMPDEISPTYITPSEGPKETEEERKRKLYH